MGTGLAGDSESLGGAGGQAPFRGGAEPQVWARGGPHGLTSSSVTLGPDELG